MNKPRKPLRGLFTKTEVQESKLAPKVQAAPQASAPKASVKPEPKAEAKPVHKAATPAAKPQPKVETKPVVTQKPAPAKQSAVVAASSITRPETSQSRIADAISKVNYNFEMYKTDRDNWQANQYVEFIKRIDTAQTEAFFLKGKLLEEAKRRFFEDNKIGWAEFCETQLLMNYTTTNQYIRVSQEFDVTSHQRPDFGFEHFKALLPLAPEERQALIKSLPTISVKQLRNMVQERLAKTVGPKEQASPVVQARSLLKQLQQLKAEILKCDPELLMQEQRWQLSAASRNVAEELIQLSNALNPAVFGSTRSRRSESATAE